MNNHQPTVVKRIVSNLATTDVKALQKFYLDLFDLDVVMDQSWMVTLSSGQAAQTQISIASEGGSGTVVPDLSIEVDDVNAVYERTRNLGLTISYDLTDEPWGVRRFYIQDPTGKLLNILAHSN